MRTAQRGARLMKPGIVMIVWLRAHVDSLDRADGQGGEWSLDNDKGGSFKVADVDKS